MALVEGGRYHDGRPRTIPTRRFEGWARRPGAGPTTSEEADEMTTITMIIAVSCLVLGFFLGRQADKSPGRAACPRCRQQRLYYCRGCGHHFDEGDSVIDPREFERMTIPGFQRDEIDN